jgi:hypothetical protein
VLWLRRILPIYAFFSPTDHRSGSQPAPFLRAIDSSSQKDWVTLFAFRFRARLLQVHHADRPSLRTRSRSSAGVMTPEEPMRWIDVKLPLAGTCPETDRLLEEARTLTDEIPGLQDRLGLDTLAVLQRMEQVGHLLFQALTAHDPAAFHPDIDRDGADTPSNMQPDRGQGPAYHIMTPEEWTGLPWHWLHNGVGFLLESAAVCAAEHGSRIPEIDPPRLWMQRHSDALFDDLDVQKPQRDDCRSNPEILFVPGHSSEEVRRLIFREAEGIDDALRAGVPSVARLRIPGAVSPGLLAARAMLYQGLHFAAPTSQPPEVSKAGENRWLAGLMAAAGQDDAAGVDELVGMEMEILGLDPVEAALDQAIATHARRDSAVPVGSWSAGIGQSSATGGWILDDGAVLPERLGQAGLPPLVFSNSWCSLAWLGQRFRQAGASTFIGTSIPIYSRPARTFAAIFYQHLATGLDLGSAHRQASLALRERLGPEHPAWLAYGMQGYGNMLLSDL